ncbi:MAG: hypothetical protein AAGI07_10830 [Bacteroidota bacterium]
MKRLLIFSLILSISIIAYNSEGRQKRDEKINIWYGDEQTFGQIGRAQDWINILGNVARNQEWEKVTYLLNANITGELTLGGDKHRLANKGDFNIEISWEDVNEGKNELLITAIPQKGKTVTKEVTINVEKGNLWPLPYHVDFSTVSSLQEVVQVVDGKWEITPEGVKTVEPYYDRVLTIGDTNWTNYEANITFTINGFTPPEKGPPTFNVTHFGVAFRWRGHAPDRLQPNRKWFPLGAQGEFLLKNNLDSCTWRILFDGGKGAPPAKYTQNRNAISLDKKMRIRAQVSTLPNGDTQYRFKQWMLGQPEPFRWDVEGVEEGKRDFPSGALCLVPHNSDVTIHEVTARSLVLPKATYSALPGSGMLHYSAPVGGVQGASGKSFFTEVLPLGSKLQSLQVNLGEAPLKIVKGFRCKVLHTTGKVEEVLIGASDGNWQPEFEIDDAVEFVGISGASGWWFDNLQFHFSDGSMTPSYGGNGGDTTFNLFLNKKNGEYGGRIRGFHGISAEQGIATLGLIFDPAD